MNKNYLPIFFFVILLVSNVPKTYSSSYALLVGISHYSKYNTGWEDINGVNDVNVLNKSLLKQGFTIEILNDDDATAVNIRKAMQGIAKKAHTKDTIYLHFSGHGQVVEDLDGDEPDGWDESFIPIDAQMWYKQGIYEGKNHITDDEFNDYFNKIRRIIGKKGLLLVVFDACHSGTMSRDGNDANTDDEAAIRGTYVGFSKDKVYHPIREKNAANHYAIQTDNQLSPVIILEACQAWQQNTEVLIDGDYYGPLSYSIYSQLQTETIDNIVHNLSKIEETMKAILPPWRKQQIVIETNIR